MNETVRHISELKGSIPEYHSIQVTERYQQALMGLRSKIVVLDDDPTGVQTVHDVYVYTDWSYETMCRAFLDENKIFFLLTNSRGLTADESAAVHREIAKNLSAAAQETGRDFLLVSRSDSTLRGHYPLETQVLRDALEAQCDIHYDGEIIMPFFPEGGRYTVDNVHYVASDGLLHPVGTTEFARDKSFGYSASSLPEWIEERSGYPKKDVVCISLSLLRECEYETITTLLSSVSNFGKVVVNAVDYNDVRVFVTALLAALSNGKRFLYRTAAAFPKILAGIGSRLWLTRQDLQQEGETHGGLIIAGSHVSKTTAQLARLRTMPELCVLELNQHLVVNPSAMEQEICRVVAAAESAIASGRTALVFTKRERLDVGGSREAELNLAVRISDAVTSVVERLAVRPAWVVAKGGITSSEIGVKGLGVKRARVMGQVMAGVPVWETDAQSKFPNLSYIIFPGNVGDENALRQLADELC